MSFIIFSPPSVQESKRWLYFILRIADTIFATYLLTVPQYIVYVNNLVILECNCDYSKNFHIPQSKRGGENNCLLSHYSYSI